MEPFIGEVELFPYTFVPTGWSLCDGKLLNIQEYQALYAIIRVTYGGDGITTFALPNLLGTEPIPFTKFCIAIQGYFPSRG